MFVLVGDPVGHVAEMVLPDIIRTFQNFNCHRVPVDRSFDLALVGFDDVMEVVRDGLRACLKGILQEGLIYFFGKIMPVGLQLFIAVFSFEPVINDVITAVPLSDCSHDAPPFTGTVCRNRNG